MKTSIFLIIATLLFPFFPLQQDEDLRQRTVIVTIIEADGSPAADKTMELSIRKPLTRIECTTDADGRCEMVVGTNEDLVNGIIFIIGSGRQSVLFKGDLVEIKIRLTTEGLIDLPQDLHSEPPPTVDPAAVAPIVEPTVTETIIQPTEIPAAVEVEDEVEEVAPEEEEEGPALVIVEKEPVDTDLLAEPTVTEEEIGQGETNEPSRFIWALWILVIGLIGLAGGAAWVLREGAKS